MDEVILELEEQAIEAVAEKAISRNTGARGLRAILEEVMLEVMYDIPSSVNVEKCIITKDTINEATPPEIIINENKKSLKKSTGKKARMKRESVS
jgi:ATP-dependent Clp protease ATP-binding subunit ClpX